MNRNSGIGDLPSTPQLAAAIDIQDGPCSAEASPSAPFAKLLMFI
jgi:hypothetical protein